MLSAQLATGTSITVVLEVRLNIALQLTRSGQHILELIIHSVVYLRNIDMISCIGYLIWLNYMLCFVSDDVTRKINHLFNGFYTCKSSA